MDNKQLYKITLTREQLMLISRCVEDISRYAAGDMGLQHTTETLIDDMDRTESLGIRSFIVNNSMADVMSSGDDSRTDKHVDHESMADVLWVLICLANQTGIDLTEELQKKTTKKTTKKAASKTTKRETKKETKKKE